MNTTQNATDRLQFPMSPEQLGEIAKADGVKAGQPFPKGFILGDGLNTCLIHRCHEWSTKFYAPLMPLCAVCGGRCDPRQTTHPLCFERSKRGLPTPQLDSFHACGCAKCVSASFADMRKDGAK